MVTSESKVTGYRLFPSLKGTLPILCYHDVAPESVAGRRLNISPEVFETHVAWFARRAYQFCTANSLEGSWPTRGVWLTFDDGFRSMVHHGVPVMERHAATGSVYVVGHLLGTMSTWDSGFEKPLASVDELTEAFRAGLEIGNHTWTHANLSSLEPELQMREVSLCQEHLLNQGFAQTSLAYPFGHYDRMAVEAVQSCNYSFGLGLGRRAARQTDNKLTLPRIVISFGDRLPRLLYKLFLKQHLWTLRDRPHYVR